MIHLMLFFYDHQSVLCIYFQRVNLYINHSPLRIPSLPYNQQYLLSERVSFPNNPDLICLSLQTWLHGCPTNHLREITVTTAIFHSINLGKGFVDLIVSDYVSVSSRNQGGQPPSMSKTRFGLHFKFLLLKLWKKNDQISPEMLSFKCGWLTTFQPCNKWNAICNTGRQPVNHTWHEGKGKVVAWYAFQ